MQVRNTRQRQIILDVMKDNYTHPTADEIYEKVHAVDEHISRGTVYRNLGFLAESGEILKISVPDQADHYDSTLHKHYHFCCSNCGKMCDVPEIMKIEASAVYEQMAKQGFLISSHNLIFSGLCPDCNKNK